jgi:hypothetical protein
VLITSTSSEEDEPATFGKKVSEPDTTNPQAPNLPIITLLSEDTSNIGSPDILLTAIRTPVKQSVIANNCP